MMKIAKKDGIGKRPTRNGKKDILTTNSYCQKPQSLKRLSHETLLIAVLAITYLYGCKTAENKIIERRVTKKSRTERYYYYLSADNREIKHGLYIHILKNYLGKPVSKTVGVYSNNKPIGLWANESVYQKLFRFYDAQGQLTIVETYNGKDEKVSSCSMQNEQPYEGTFWDLATGINGIKWSRLLTYKNGQVVKEQNCSSTGEPSSLEAEAGSEAEAESVPNK